MRPEGFTRREYYGTTRENVISIAVVVGSVGLALLGLFRFPLLNQNDASIWKVPLCAYVASLAIVISKRQKLFPWGDRLPFIKWQAVIAVPVVSAMAALGVFLVGNAVLDHGAAQERVFVVVRQTAKTSFWIAPAERPDSSHSDLYVRRPPADLTVGRLVRVAVKPGLFRHPWVERYEVLGGNAAAQ